MKELYVVMDKIGKICAFIGSRGRIQQNRTSFLWVYVQVTTVPDLDLG